MIVRPPVTDPEFAAYYALRYAVLRRPWGEPNGSELDEFEDTAFHLTAIEDDTVVGVGRLHPISPTEGQIRYMAVHEDFSGRGVGTQILNGLEAGGRERGFTSIMLNAREHAVGFYARNGYETMGEGPLLWDEIRHKVMRKQLAATEAPHG
ncbi:GNAT family N-acetyltransferase [Cerasicoccus arenae]|nr:GNAT family N-acetyltransferase [Cerasicoccus arenae]MBK1859061.1 GNAT family N-acetyltransferase [Cerasicoccus arenae]